MIRVVVAPRRDEIGKFQAIVLSFPGTWHGTVLDVGCRSGKLREILQGSDVAYIGMDLLSPASVVANFEAGLPFKNMSCDLVVALDVLEHIDHFHFGFSEACRVTSRYLVVCLPNMYHFSSRILYLLGRNVSGKYGLPPEPPPDRHRWLFGFYEARETVKKMAESERMGVVDEFALIGPRQAKLAGTWLPARAPNLFARFYVALLERRF